MKAMYPTEKVIRIDTKTPCLMDCAHINCGDKPDFFFPINGDIWMVSFDEMYDVFGNLDDFQVIPVDSQMLPMGTDARRAYEYFYAGADSKEYGESISPLECETRKKNFAIIWEFLTTKKIEYKEVG